jgi:S1-C subfamily serine protease
MACAILIYSARLARILTYCALLSGAPSMEHALRKEQSREVMPILVRVFITTETHGAKDTVEINGKLLTDYKIIQAFSAAGIVLDHRGHIMTFLGYRWIDIQNHDPRIEISTAEGQKWKGKLVGIDQSNGVAVIRLLNGKPQKTPICAECEVKDGAVIMAPVVENPGPSQYQEAQVVSVDVNQGMMGQASWVVEVNRPIPDVGLPILTTDHRVIGFAASQDPMGMRTVVYPISQLLSSAEEILKKGKDIHAGWLGVFLIDAHPAAGSGIVIRRVEPDSPAQKAGLSADDFVLKYNGKEVRDARQFIHLVQSTPIGSKANLEIIRQGNPMTVTAQVEARKPQQNPAMLSFNLPGVFGMPVAAATPEPRSRIPRLLFGLDTIVLTPALAEAVQMPGQTGLLVIDVAKQLPADRAGVLVGDVIVAIDGQPVIDGPSFASYLQTHNWAPQSVLRVIRKGIERIITVQIPDQDK